MIAAAAMCQQSKAGWVVLLSYENANKHFPSGYVSNFDKDDADAWLGMGAVYSAADGRKRHLSNHSL